MEIAMGFKLLAFMFWPLLLVFLYFLADRQRFKRRWQRFKQIILKDFGKDSE